MRFLLIFVISLQCFNLLAQEGDYYQNCLTLQGDSLKACLHELIKNHKEYSYKPHKKKLDVPEILQESDRDSLDPENVICVYSGKSVNGKEQFPTWEKEHIWSQSHGDFGRKEGAGSDIHHLKPVLSKTNRSSGKSNKDFGEGGVELLFKDGSTTHCHVSDSTFEPRDEVKGDVARMMFYMVVRYEGLEESYDLELLDSLTRDMDIKNVGYYGKSSVLLKWHKEDPVDEFELNRNEVIYKYQGNRNPFIDHPDWVGLIWD